MDCLFCKIAQKDIKSEAVIYETGEVMAFLDIHPISKGHTLVIPKKHAASLINLDDNDILSLFDAVKKIIINLKSTLMPDGFTVGINHGKDAGQVVEHLHIHVIPRWRNDGGGTIHSVVKNPPAESLTEIANIIKKSPR